MPLTTFRRRVSAGALFAALALLLALPGVAHAQQTYNRGIEDACPDDPGNQFPDDNGNTHEAAINCAAHWNIAEGKDNGDYDPDGFVTREQMASFIVRMMQTAGYEFPDNPPNAFPDDNDSFHHTNINRLAAAGVVEGDEDGNYNPGEPVSRAQMASFIARAIEAVIGGSISSDGDFFDDDDGDTHEQNINKLASQGIVQGDTSGNYNPDHPVRRDQMASFIIRGGDYLAETGNWPDPDQTYPPAPDGQAANVDSGVAAAGDGVGSADEPADETVEALPASTSQEATPWYATKGVMFLFVGLVVAVATSYFVRGWRSSRKAS